MRRALLLFGLPAVVIEGALVGLNTLEHPFQSLTAFLLLTSAASVAWIAAVVAGWKKEPCGRGLVVFLFIAGAVFRATLMPFPYGGDMNRYLWEGRLQLEGKNPFAHAPNAPEVESLRDEVWDGINGKPYASIYPPVSQLLFMACAGIRYDFVFFKAVFALFDLLTGVFLLLLLRRTGAPPQRVIAYLWCPQLLIAVAARGHLDSVQTCFMVLAIVLFKHDRMRWAALALGFAIQAKTLAVLLVPVFFLHARRKRDLWPLALPLLLYLPYASAGHGLIDSLVFMGVGTHATDPANGAYPWITNASLYSLLTGFRTVPYVVYGVAALAYVFLVLRSRTVEDGAFVAWACFLVFTPTFHPWYVVAIVPFLALRLRVEWLILCWTLFLYFSFWVSGQWRPIAWIPLVEYAPFYGLMAWRLWRTRR